MRSISLTAIPPESLDRLKALGGHPTNLYRALANQPQLMEAFAHFALTLRQACATPRRLRELLIIRTAQLCGSTYELRSHSAIAAKVGIVPEEIEELARWNQSTRFSASERAALRYAEEIVRLGVSDAAVDELRTYFNDAERVELTLTVAFYTMVPRIVDALAIPE